MSRMAKFFATVDVEMKWLFVVIVFFWARLSGSQFGKFTRIIRRRLWEVEQDKNVRISGVLLGDTGWAVEVSEPKVSMFPTDAFHLLHGSVF